MTHSVLTVFVEVKVFEEFVKVGVEVVLHAHLEIVGQPQSVCIIHQTIIVHPHHLVLHMYMSIKRLTFAFAFSHEQSKLFRFLGGIVYMLGAKCGFAPS